MYLSSVLVYTMGLHQAMALGCELTPRYPTALATRGVCPAEAASTPSAF